MKRPRIKNDNRSLWVQESNTQGEGLPGYPAYPESEDIYENDQEEKEIDPEDTLLMKESTEKDQTEGSSELETNHKFSGDDLDIPGAELDDDMENIGSEDEENNYYSLSGDDHQNLEEDQGKE
jgi:hypothetical protein